MRNRLVFLLALVGLAIGLGGAYFFNAEKKTQPPVFSPAPNPYPRGIYANGIIESFQAAGENINLFPEVSGPIASILVTEGQAVTKGTSLIAIDDAVQRAVADQQRSQAEAALAQLQALKAQPRRETLAITEAQLELARANLKNAQDQYDKQSRLYEIDRKAVSKDALDSATNALKVAAANVEVAQRQLELTRAGAWSFDIENQQRQYDALHNAYLAGIAQLAKYTLRAPADGVILSIRAAVGSYASPQGTYSTYTGGTFVTNATAAGYGRALFARAEDTDPASFKPVTLLLPDGTTKETLDFALYGWFDHRQGKATERVQPTVHVWWKGRWYGSWGDETGPCVWGAGPEHAPVLHVGGPLHMGFEVPAASALERKGDGVYELSVGVGTPGVGKGSFVHLSYAKGAIPEGVFPVAELEFPNKAPGGPPVRLRTVLKQRC